jgi:hypothetical protein
LSELGDCAAVTVKKMTLAFGLPVVLDGLLLHLVPHDLFVPWGASAAVGFLFLTQHCGPRTRMLIALGYFPLMILIFFFGSLLVSPLAVTIRE